MSADESTHFVNEETRTGIVEYIGRILEHATPDSLVAGGGTEDKLDFKRRPRNYKELKQREAIYLNGGPVTAFIDTRSMMMYGTGVEFQTETAITDDQGQTVDEYLERLLPNLELHFTEAATHTYWAGDAWPEIVESRDGEFSHLNLIDPTTVDVTWDEHGGITDLEQIVQTERGQVRRQSLDTDLVGHYWFKRAPGGPLGQSLVEQNMDEIETYARNAAQRRNAIRLHGSPHYSISVGSEGQSIPDKIMRRVRNRFRSDQTDEETNWVHGGDIEVNELDVPGFEGMGDIIETDIAALAMGFNVPIEWTNFGSAGLGEGTPAKSRLLAFERVARTEQRLRANQFIHDVIRVILDRYSPFPKDIDVQLVFGDVVSDQAATAEWMSQFSWALHRDEVRERLDVPAWDDEDDREAPPETDPNAAQGDAGGGIGGMFEGAGTDFPSRALEVPDNAVSIDDASEAPEGASVINGPRGGLYYVPGGVDDGADGGSDNLSASPEFSDDPPDGVDISNATSETNLTEAGVPAGDMKEDITIVDTDDGQVFVKEQGLMDFVREQGWEGTTMDPLASTQMGSAVTRAVGGGTTANWVDSENDIIRSEGVENMAGVSSNQDIDVDTDSLTDTVAAGLLAGNEDMHAAQFAIDEDGQSYLIDHDHSGRSLADDRVISKVQAVSGPLSAQGIDFEDAWNRAKEQVEGADIENMATDLEAQGLDNHADVLRENAEFIRTTDAAEVAQ